MHGEGMHLQRGRLVLLLLALIKSGCLADERRFQILQLGQRARVDKLDMTREGVDMNVQL